VHVHAWIDARAAIDQAFERTADALRQRCASLVNRGHVRAQRLREQQQNEKVDAQLQPS